MKTAHEMFKRRAERVRYKLRKATRRQVARLSVFRSNTHIYAQIIDDVDGKTIASASSLDKELKLKSGSNVDAAQKVGALIAKRAKAAKVANVVFDRGGYIYHGRVKALAESAREAGMEF